MANRPVFLPLPSGTALVRTINVEFIWHAGLAVSQKQKSIDSLHAAARTRLSISSVLEISSKSSDRLGVALSAFNLHLQHAGRSVPIEILFQSSKRFEKGGPYSDLLNVLPREAKRDPRLQTSGRLIEFVLGEERWPTEPRTAFYDWIYINALRDNPDLASQLFNYQAFTDIEFNPERSINCQANSAALFVSLVNQGVLDSALTSKDSFLNILTSKRQAAKEQQELF